MKIKARFSCFLFCIYLDLHYLCIVRPEKPPDYKESVFAFVLRNEIAKIRTGRMKGHDAHPFLSMPVRLMPRKHIKTAWEHCVSVHLRLGVWRCLFLDGWQQVLTPFPVY